MSNLDEKLDDKLEKIVSLIKIETKEVHKTYDGVPFSKTVTIVHGKRKAKQAIKQFIASELNKRLNAHYADALGTYDYDGIAESMIEWMGELQGESV